MMKSESYPKEGAIREPGEPLHTGVNLEGTNILAFGGGGNLSERFLYAAARAGASVAIADFLPPEPEAANSIREKVFSIARTLGSLGPKKFPPVIFGDVRRNDEIARSIETAKQELGRIDIGIDFAGVHHRPFDLLHDEPEDLDAIFSRVVDINLRGAFLITLHLARAMVTNRKGHIIHLCSNGSRLSLYGSYGYNASKHGLEGLVKTAAAQLAPYGIRVNAIAPGTVETNLTHDLLRDKNNELKPRAKSILAHTPSKKFCSRDGIAETLLSMCVEQRHLTGNVLFADDGYNIEGHSWPEGNQALYAGQSELDELYKGL